jgi:hypothetical protein
MVVMFTFNVLTTIHDGTLMYSLDGNNIDDAGAQALAEGLQHCTNLQMLV